MENLQAHNYGCQEMNAADVKDVNGGFFLFSLSNTNGKISAGSQMDTSGLTSGLSLPGGGGGLPGLGGLGSLLSPVTSLLNSLLGSLGGGILGL